MKHQPSEKELKEWYDRFKKGDLVRCNIDYRNSNQYRVIHPNVSKIRVVIPLVGKSKSKIHSDKGTSTIYDLWGDGSYQFNSEGKPFYTSHPYRDYRIGYEDDVEIVK